MRIDVYVSDIQVTIQTKTIKSFIIEDPEIKNGLYTGSVEVELDQAVFKVSCTLMVKNQFIELLVGAIYIDEYGTSYQAISHHEMTIINGSFKEHYRSPNYVILVSSRFKEG